MKITKVETVELTRSTAVHWGTIGWLWVRVHTDENLIGLGETCPATAAEKAVVLNDLSNCDAIVNPSETVVVLAGRV